MKYLLPLLFFTTFAHGQTQSFQDLEGIYPITSIEAGLTDDYIEKQAAALFNGVGILGIGENVHGSKQILQIQKHLIQYAIEKQGVRTIFFESNLFRTKEINQYLDTCEGNLMASLQSARSWAMEDEMNTLNWICQYNQKKPFFQRVQIIGVDIYNFSELNHQWVIEKTKGTKHGTKIENLLNQTTNVCVGHGKPRAEYMDEIYSYYYKNSMMSPINFERCNQILGSVLKFLSESKTGLDKKTTAYERAELRTYVRNLLAMQWYWLNRFSLGDSLVRAWKPRDSAMAENVLDFWNTLGKPKSIFLAHTSHVAKYHAPFIQEKDLTPEKSQHIYPAGTYLREKLGSLYKTVGFTGFDTDGIQGNFLPATSPQSLDLFIKENFGWPIAWITLKPGMKTFDQHWCLQHENGGQGAFKDGVWMNPVQHYDALIYVEKSVPTIVVEEDQEPPSVLELPKEKARIPSVDYKSESEESKN